jgi:hypothetical protein
LGKQQYSEEIEKMEAIDILNKMARDMGLFPKRRRSSFIWWRIPKDWNRTKYAFGYTPWRTRLDGKEGFFACKYRVLKNGSMKLVKAVRFGRRKVAKNRSLQWHQKYYNN